MGIFRSHRKQHNFSILDNSGAEDEKLSLKGKGLLWYLLTKPDGWVVRNEHLMATLKIGKEQLASAVRDLEDAGYLIRIKHQADSGKFEWTVEVFETPQDCEKWKELHQDLVDSALDGSTSLRVPKRKRVRHQSSTRCGKPGSGFPGAGKPGSLVNTESVITDPGITEFNQAINQATKAFCENAMHKGDFGEKDVAKKQEQPNTPKTMPTVNQTSAVGGIDPRQDNYSANSPKKEKQTKVAFKYDDYGVVQFPTAPRYKLPSILAMRSMQFLLAQQLECEFAVDSNGAIWIADPKMGDWMSEDEMFGGGSDGELGHLSLKKMVSILNSETAPSQLNIEWYNEAAKRYFHYWQSNCQRLDQNAMDVIGQKSVGLWLQQLDPYFDIELVDFDEVA